MATKDEQPGLFSKMASFMLGSPKEKAVSVLPEPENDSVNESAYDKNALKAMIERKRHNDLIRKHEFDALRKLRNNNVLVSTSSARPSVFQASVPSDLEGRADTLKKIDEIEAQMSKQWWKGKQDAAAASQARALPSATPVAPVREPPRQLVTQHAPATAAMAHHFDKTLPIEHLVNSTAVVLDSFKSTEAMDPGLSKQLTRLPEFNPTQVDARIQPMALDLDFGPLDRSYTINHTHTPGPEVQASPDIALDLDGGMLEFAFEDMVTDPELEEASIRFANGDEAGAEQSLLDALATPGAAENAAKSWVSALLDLFRATNNKARFEAVAKQFSSHLVSASPVWYAVSGEDSNALADSLDFGLSLPDLNVPEPETASASDAMWDCPKELTAASLLSLQQALAQHPQPWRLGWSRLSHIAPDAMPLLGVVLRKFCDEVVQLQFIGAERLIHQLGEMTPTMESSVAPAWWMVRLSALRVVQLHDDFENVAVDYCVTYEVSPPDWMPAKCHYENYISAFAQAAPVAPVAALMRTEGIALDAADALSKRVMPTVPDGAIVLHGEILGDALDALEAHFQGNATEAPRYRSGDTLEVFCMHLVRVDFSAAGSILNWAAMRQSEGCKVQFREVNRMVAAFFNVIGIHEHARVIPPPL